jgi:hypothetical protein
VAVGRFLRIEVSSTLTQERLPTSTDDISPLRQRTIEDMSARKLNPYTQRSHIGSCKRFAAYLKRSPDTATADEIPLFQLQLTETGTSICNRNRVMTGTSRFNATTIGCWPGESSSSATVTLANQIEFIGRFAFAEQIRAPSAKRRLRAQPEIALPNSGPRPAKNGCSRTMRSSPLHRHPSVMASALPGSLQLPR